MPQWTIWLLSTNIFRDILFLYLYRKVKDINLELDLVAFERPGLSKAARSTSRSISDLHTAIDSNGYDSDDILSQALYLFEEMEGERIFITQNTYNLGAIMLPKFQYFDPFLF